MLNSTANKVTVTLGLVMAAVVGFVSTAGAVADPVIVDSVTDGGTNMSDTMLAIAAALIPLAIGVFIARKAWRFLKAFF